MSQNLMITGSFPPDICGVGDYVSCFINAADKSKWTVYYSKTWKLWEIRRKIKSINSYKCKYIFMQYPTQGYGWSLLPQLLCLYYSLFTSNKFIVVLHELSQRSFKAKIATFFLLFANKVIFTNNFEKEYAGHLFPFVKKRSYTIRILSNIVSAPKIYSWKERHYDLIYFGHIRPLKGLEDFFYAVECVQKKENTPIKVAIVGQVLPEFERYINALKMKYADLQIDYKFNNSIQNVSLLLNNAKLAFLPFPDGISERRGSFLAAITNGTLVLTYHGKFVTESLSKICSFTTLEKSSTCICNILSTMTDSEYDRRRKDMKDYLTNELPSSWSEIVKSYERVCTQ